MDIKIKYMKNDTKKIDRVHIEGMRTCAFGTYRQAVDVTVDRKEVRIVDINNVTSMWMNKTELLRYIELLHQIHDQMED